jgi:hypothetical protein
MVPELLPLLARLGAYFIYELISSFQDISWVELKAPRFQTTG